MQTEFKDENLDEADVDFKGATKTPYRLHGRGAMVYWRDCDVTLMKPVDGDLEYVRTINKRTGKGRLHAGIALVFMGAGGEVKTE